MREQFKQRLIEASIWALWWLVFSSGAVWVIVWSAGWWVRLGWADAQAASWAQAFGSILAVAVAAVVPWLEVVRGRRERLQGIKRARLISIKNMYAIISRLKEPFEKLAAEPSLLANPLGVNTILSVELEEAALMVKELQLTQVESEHAFILIGAKEVAACALFLLKQPQLEGREAVAANIAANIKAKANVELMSNWLKLLESEEQKLLSS